MRRKTPVRGLGKAAEGVFLCEESMPLLRRTGRSAFLYMIGTGAHMEICSDFCAIRNICFLGKTGNGSGGMALKKIGYMKKIL